jgi:hypothetical protein
MSLKFRIIAMFEITDLQIIFIDNTQEEPG